MLKNLTLKPLLMVGVSTAIIFTAGCGNKAEKPENKTSEPAKVEASEPEVTQVTLADVIADPRRLDDMARDQFRHPKETLEFFGITADMNVGEVWPGWYTPIIAPYLATGRGSYTAILYQDSAGERAIKRNAAFAEKYVGLDGFGTINTASFGQDDQPITKADSLDMILTFRNVHNWMGRGYGDKAFADFYAALKPGGILGVVEHRLPESALQDPKGSTGYVQESYMKDMAKRAGFEFVAASDVNANPRDTADHPVGVWTLPPRSATPKEDSPEAEGFDAELYKNIGESDRATLKFRKPL
ncbi:MAG: class I SAM-dependent methyltransferase [Maricaulaceae bacterium]